MTKESRGKAYVVGQWEAGTQCTDLGWTCCERTLDELPTDGLRNARIYIYIYSAETVLSTELSQAVTKELVTNGLTFNL